MNTFARLLAAALLAFPVVASSYAQGFPSSPVRNTTVDGGKPRSDFFGGVGSAGGNALAPSYPGVRLGGPGNRIQPLPWTDVMRGQHSGIVNPQIRVISSQAAFDRYWLELGASQGHFGYPKPVGINFENERIVAIHLGQKNTGGYGISLNGVFQQTTGYWDVSFNVHQPVPGSLVTQGFTSPFQIFRVPAFQGQPRFLPYYPHQRTTYYVPAGRCTGETSVFQFGGNVLRKIDPETGEVGPPLGGYGN
jgi:hypothetical protein